MKPLRIWLVGFGTVGRWAARALDSEWERLAGKYGIAVAVVAVAHARDGFICDRSGLGLRSVLGLAQPLVDRLAGTVPLGLRGLLNATAHFILSRTVEGTTYEEALAEARAGCDSSASQGSNSSHPMERGTWPRAVEPELVPGDDPLASIDATSNAVVCRANPIGEVTIIRPGAGPQLAEQGAFTDLIAIARSRTSDWRVPKPKHAEQPYRTADAAAPIALPVVAWSASASAENVGEDARGQVVPTRSWAGERSRRDAPVRIVRSMTRIGVIGSGNIGATLGEAWRHAGHDVLYARARTRSRCRSETRRHLRSFIAPLVRRTN